MTRLERMVARETIPLFFIGSSLFIGVLLLWKVLAQPFLSLLPAQFFFPWLTYQIPNFALQAFPFAAVFTALMVFGRLARENELLAAQSGGISLATLARPVLLFGVLVTVLGLVVSQWIAPRANEQVSLNWGEGVWGNPLIRIASKRLRLDSNTTLSWTGVQGNQLQNILLEEWKGSLQTITRARTAEEIDKKLVMVGFYKYTLNHDAFPPPNEITSAWTQQAFPEIQRVALNANARTIVPIKKTTDRLVAENDGAGFEDPRSLSDLYTEHQDAKDGAEKREIASLLGLKTALPFASFIILLFGIVIASRGARNTSTALGYAVLITIGFYVALFMGRTLGQMGVLPAFLAPWLANIGFLVAGVWLLRSREIR
jgi:lipopolysaccharide export LptBFGC system permease protein LptF